ncbi:MAG: acyloxyacyl hydrolase [Flavobacteriia bacterium]|nr:acyloxyacyl hydrolase [Flavobacteriia bacterium]
MKTIFLFFYILIFYNALGQNKYTWGIESRTKIGFLAAHHNTMEHLAIKDAFAQETSLFIQPNGSKKWHLDYRKPYIGFTSFLASVGNKNILGNFYGFYQFIEFPFVKRSKYIFSAKLGNGFAYGTKHYDPIIDPKNTAIGSHINALICIGLMNRFDFKKHHFSIGIDITHCSNAASKTPNLGINLPFFSIGYGYTIKQSSAFDTIKEYTSPFQKWNFGVTGICSAKETYPTEGRKYPIYALSLFARKFFKPKVGIEFAFDVFSKQSTLAYKPDISKTQLDILQVGFFTGYLLPLDRVHFVLGMGVYLRDKYQPESFLYHRVGMRYFMKNGVFFNFVLKSHFASADYFESGIGYTFKYGK